MTKLPDAPWRHRAGMGRLLAALDARSGATRFVGGCVRDALLALEQSDVDLATRLTPDEVLARLEAAHIKAVPTGIAHGTITAVVAGKPVEVTTLRRDVSTDGRRATVAFTDDWTADAARRDFTINALSADPLSGEVFDYFGGLGDLEARRVRFIGDPLQRIAEDHLRILRFFRFHARFGADAPDAEGLEACAARANDLMALSRERIADELLKLLALPDPTATVRLMIDRGILRPVLPEIESVDVLERLTRRERAAGQSPNAIRRLAALLPPQKPGDADHVASRLRLSKANRGRLIGANGYAASPPREAAYYLGKDIAIDQYLNWAGTDEEAIAAATDLAEWTPPKFPMAGGAIVARGIEAGPDVARLMMKIETHWVQEGFPDKARVDALADEAVAQLLRSSQ
jgi:poly(A) polymerase